PGSDDLVSRTTDTVDHTLAADAAIPSPCLTFEGHIDGGDILERHALFGQSQHIQLGLIVAGDVEEAILPKVTPGAGTFAPGGDDLGGKQPRLQLLPLVVVLNHVSGALIEAWHGALVAVVGKTGPPVA